MEHLDDEALLTEIKAIKKDKKAELAAYIKEKEGQDINPDSIFDIQVKRLHEYKRQQMNALYIIHKYLEIKGGKKPSTIHILFWCKGSAGIYYCAGYYSLAALLRADCEQ